MFGDPVAVAAAKPASSHRARRAQMVALGRHPTGFELASLGHPGHGRTCGDCRLHYVRQLAGRYHKCRLVPATGGPASDILVRWPACERWEEAEDAGRASTSRREVRERSP